MKSVICTIALTLLSAQAFAANCYSFTNGGPSQLVNKRLEAPAQKVCITNVSGFTGSYTAIEFSDSQGPLAKYSAQEIGTGRCAHLCKSYSLLDGVIANPNHPGGNELVTYTIGQFTLKLEAKKDGDILEIKTSRSLPETYDIKKDLR